MRMNTYVLTGNPREGKEGGMRRELYQESYDRWLHNGSAEDHWTMWSFRSEPDHQVVLLLLGVENLGLVGFGVRRAGEWQEGFKGRREYPVTFNNLRSLEDEPYISSAKLKDRGFWRGDNFQRGGTEVKGKLLKALEECCKQELDVDLSKLCGSSYTAPAVRIGPDAHHDDQQDADELQRLESPDILDTHNEGKL
jgi:hypothetical protein